MEPTLVQVDPGLGVDRATTGGMKREMIKPTRTIVSLLLGNFISPVLGASELDFTRK